MPGGTQLFVVVAVIVGAAVVSFIMLGGDATSDFIQETPEELEEAPDLHLETAHIRQFRADGALKYELDAKQIRHFERESLTRMIEPHLNLQQESGAPWLLASNYGYIRSRQTPAGGMEEVVYMRENVVIEQRRADGSFVRLETPSIYLYPDRQYAETTQDVMIDTDVGRTRAVGLQGQLERGLLHLSSNEDQRVHTIVLQGQFK